jgi:hypothetical protein
MTVRETPREDRPRRKHVLPLSLPKRGYSRLEAAEYIGVGTSKFDEMVADGRMPKPKQIDRRNVWDLHQLDLAFEALPDGNEHAEDIWEKCAV